LEETGRDLAAAREEKRNVEARADTLEAQRNNASAELAIIRRAKKELEERVYTFESMRNKDDARYRELTQDYEKVADEKAELRKEIEKHLEERKSQASVLESLNSTNADMKRELARLSAPKFATPKSQQQRRSQSADATTPPRQHAASSAGSSASSRAASSTSGSRRGSRSAKMF